MEKQKLKKEVKEEVKGTLLTSPVPASGGGPSVARHSPDVRGQPSG